MTHFRYLFSFLTLFFCCNISVFSQMVNNSTTNIPSNEMLNSFTSAGLAPGLAYNVSDKFQLITSVGLLVNLMQQSNFNLQHFFSISPTFSANKFLGRKTFLSKKALSFIPSIGLNIPLNQQKFDEEVTKLANKAFFGKLALGYTINYKKFSILSSIGTQYNLPVNDLQKGRFLFVTDFGIKFNLFDKEISRTANDVK